MVAVERHSELARLARERMERLGYDNVRVVEGDGSVGMAEAAPFDAIIASAAGRHVPDALLDQLADGGALVMPVGAPGGAQRLVRVRRSGEDGFEREELEPVRFVPLIGRKAGRRSADDQSDSPRLPSRCRRSTIQPSPMPSTASRDARVILLGEASHGTSANSTAPAPRSRGG